MFKYVCTKCIRFLHLETGSTSEPHPTHLQRHESPMNGKLNGSRSMHMTRSHATSTTSNIRSTAAPPTVHDHNYMGDPGPSTSSAANIRNSRRLFSKHSHNFDESDLNGTEGIPRLRRGLPSTSIRTLPSTYQTVQTGVSVRRGRSRFSQENSQTEASADENKAEDDENEEGVSDMGTGGSTDSSATDDASDSEDNQPLTSYVPKQKGGRKPRKKRRLSDDSFVAYEEEDCNNRRNTGRKRETEAAGGRVSSRRNQRISRNQKRPRYYELSEDDEYPNSTNNRGKKLRNESSSAIGCSATNQDEQDASTMDSDDDQLVSVSSRGRVRKITAKARGIFKE